MCFLSLPQLHYSLAEPLACELAPKFRQDNLREGQVVAAAPACFATNFRWSLSCQQIKSHAVWRVFLLFARQDWEHHLSFAPPYYDCTLQCCPPGVRCFLWFVINANDTFFVFFWLDCCCSLAFFSPPSLSLSEMWDMNVFPVATFFLVNTSHPSQLLLCLQVFQSSADFFFFLHGLINMLLFFV